MSLRVLICDPEKSSRNQLYKFLAQIPLVVHATAVNSTSEVSELLVQKRINLLFIDPFTSELRDTSKLIFQIRQDFPEVIICLLVHTGEIRRRAVEFYDGERERFGHYFKLNKELPEDSFEEEAYFMLFQCYEALRGLSLHAGRIELSIQPRFMDIEARLNVFLSAVAQHAKEHPRPAGLRTSLPARELAPPLPGLAGLASQPRV